MELSKNFNLLFNHNLKIQFMKYNVDEVIGMAWSDKVSFEEIKKKLKLN